MADFTGTGYHALPPTLHIKDSPIHGQGLFAKLDIPTGTELGEAHAFLMQDFQDGVWARKEWMRTPLGAFINHSDTPNAIVEIRTPVEYPNTTMLITSTYITAGDEITVTYDEDLFVQVGI